MTKKLQVMLVLILLLPTLSDARGGKGGGKGTSSSSYSSKSSYSSSSKSSYSSKGSYSSSTSYSSHSTYYGGTANTHTNKAPNQPLPLQYGVTIRKAGIRTCEFEECTVISHYPRGKEITWQISNDKFVKVYGSNEWIKKDDIKKTR